MDTLTFDSLRNGLDRSGVLRKDQVDSVMATVGSATLGHAIIACEILNIVLSGADVDRMIDKVNWATGAE